MVEESENSGPLLVIRTLGHLEILLNGQEIEGMALRKARALFVYLLLNPGKQDRGRLAGLLWGDSAEARARHNLRHTLWHLRRALPPGLLAEDRLTVELRSDRIHVDALVFEKEIQRVNRRRSEEGLSDHVLHLQEALALYRGEFLADMDIGDCPDFTIWKTGYATTLHEEALTALSRLTEHFLQRGAYRQALAYARRQVEMEPWWEEGHRLLMTLLALDGQRGAALAQYETCRRRLAEEVGVEPMAETTALYHRLLHWKRADWVAPGPQALQLPFLGRGEERARLAAWWEVARRGSGRLSLIEGEAGIGKTRLTEEMIRYAEVQGATVLRGRCYEFGGDIPYQPIADAARSSLRTLSGDRIRLSPVWLAEMARLTPELYDLYPHLPAARNESGPAARQRLFEAVARFLRALTRPSNVGFSVPLILFLDDLHWADTSTLDLLHYLVRGLSDAPVWVVGTYRPEEVAPGHLLTRLRQGLSRDRLVDHLVLSSLSAGTVSEIARSLVGDEAAESLGDFLYRESEGNPFFLVETVYSLQEQGALGGAERRWRKSLAVRAIPHSVRDVILQRVGRLSLPARRLLTLAAVIGRRFDSALLQNAARQDAAHVSASLMEWTARHLVRPEADASQSYDFHHDKIRAVVYEAATEVERQGLHRRVGEALERSRGESDEERVGLLAYHWARAGEPDRAISYLLQAGDRARLLYAQEEAVSYYRQALDFLQATGEQEAAARTLMKLGLTYHNAFDFSHARAAYDEAFVLWQKAATRPEGPVSLPPARPLRVRWLEPSNLDPAFAPDSHTDCLVSHLFSGLVELSPEMNAIPDIARSWEVSDGGRVFVFHLRDDARWSDGVPVTAGDFEFAWKRALNPATGSPVAPFLYDLEGARAFHRGHGCAEEVGVRAVDDRTLRVKLERPVGHFLQLLTLVPWYPVPRHVVEREGNAWAERKGIVVNGAFRMEAWRRGESMELVRNPAYHGRFTGNLRRVTLLPMHAWADRLRMYRDDRLDVLGVAYLAAEEREELRQRYASEYIARPRLETHFLAFDVTRPPFDDVRVRRAFALATDRETLADRVLLGYAAPAMGGLTPPGMPGHASGIALPFRPGEARRLLAEAGYPDGQGFPVIEVLAYDAVASRNEFLRAQWRRALGVEVRVTTAGWADFLEQLGGSYHLVNLGWLADYPDPDSFLRVSRERVWSGWQHEEFDRLVQEARALTDPAERMLRYRRAEVILAREAPVLPLIYERDHLLVKPWVRAYPMSAIKPAFWKDAVLA